jgi:hypothetical protein
MRKGRAGWLLQESNIVYGFLGDPLLPVWPKPFHITRQLDANLHYQIYSFTLHDAPAMPKKSVEGTGAPPPKVSKRKLAEQHVGDHVIGLLEDERDGSWAQSEQPGWWVSGGWIEPERRRQRWLTQFGRAAKKTYVQLSKYSERLQGLKEVAEFLFIKYWPAIRDQHKVGSWRFDMVSALLISRQEDQTATRLASVVMKLEDWIAADPQPVIVDLV